ncbi:alpha/beta hydrolase [Reticulibacter mediterranei]|uniref:Alpha/beta hydrolase n=1 Tax=Reticulibacter mediterranei TaxID=2778369 RepID=A0A8J3J0P6_9CHLR|nr:alpha/beta hydrolase [Reticulibacter mediterranei]GHO98691.1 alpha/beta hydrolase [Reticulibacter mediterranei]
MLVFPAPEMEMKMKKEVSQTITGPYGIPLSVVTAGDPAAEEVVLLVHGGFQSLRCFDKQIARFAREHYVVAVDLPYHGHSGVLPAGLLPDYSVWVESLRAVVSHLSLADRSLTILAWSFGGLVVRNYLLTYGHQRLHGLILVASLFGGVGAYQSVARPEVTAVMTRMMDPDIPFPQRLDAFERWIGWLTARPLPPHEAEAQYGYTLRAFVRSLSAAQHWMDERPCDDPALFLQQMTIPTLLIQGLEDRLVPFTYTRHLACSLPHAQLLEYEDCGHAPFLEDPEQFNRDVLRFLSLRTRSLKKGDVSS